MSWIVTVLVALAVLLAAGLLLWKAGNAPYRHRNLTEQKARRLLETLLSEGIDGALLIIRVPRSPAFLQFRKYVESDRSVGIQFAFPNSAWSTQHYPALRERLDAAGIAYIERSTGRADTSHFLLVDCGRDLIAAMTVMRLAAGDVLGIDLAKEAVAQLEGVD